MGIWLSYTLRRGPRGLGIDVDGNNVVMELLPKGQAALDGLIWPGDVISCVDGNDISGFRLVDALVPGRKGYEVTAWRPNGAQIEAQALETLGRGTKEQPLRLEVVTVRRGASGLGLDIGDFSLVCGLVPGSLAEEDAVVRPGDLIIGVDGK